MDYSGNCQTLVSSDDLFIDELLDLSNAFSDNYEGDDNPCSILSPKKPEKRRLDELDLDLYLNSRAFELVLESCSLDLEA
ncbi:hypothetical protein CQW23_03189 [Capsicum baccatum]|uniref:Uncharacterized protein n=1 Tax=Capsicum baccatum TaxID=33114 RepID=A0A2G2XB52_CAPBA|nr:hypothetical protein CQW23_03189 [Capsicum baccatum]